MNINKLKALLISFVAVFTLAACNQGPAEESGEKIDEAIKFAIDNIEKQASKIENPPSAS